MPHRCLFIVLSLICLVQKAPLQAQGYETKFKATGFKPGDVYHTDEGVNVSLTGGGLEVEIPLGPALPGPIPIRPTVHYHGKYSQPLNPGWQYGQAFRDGLIGIGWTPQEQDAYEKAYKRWLPPSLPSGEVHPGYLIFRAGSTALRPTMEPDLSLTSPFGQSTSYYLGMPGTYTYLSSNPVDRSDIDNIAKTMAPEWDRTAAPLAAPGCGVLPGTPVSSSLGDSIGVRLSGGTTLIFGPSEDQLFSRWTASTNPITSTLLLVPREILQVDKEFVTLWRRSRNVYSHDWDPKDVSGTLADYRWTQSVYHPVWIKTRSGFRADVTIYRNAPGGHNACLSDGGILTGYRVSTNQGNTWFQVGYAPGTTSGPSVTFGGMDATSTDGAAFNGFTPVRPSGSDGPLLGDFQPGTTIGYDSNYTNPFFWELEYTSASLRFGASSIVYGDLTTSFEWAGPQGQLSKLTTPSGKTYTFTHQLFQGVGIDPKSAAIGASWLWSPVTPSALDYYSMVTRMDIDECPAGSAQMRSTAYRWKLPEIDQVATDGKLHWSSPAQGVAQTLPSGETILHVFSPPLDSADSHTRLELQGRTFLAGRQAVAARYHYASGDRSWESFIEHGTDPSATTWYERERFEGWDIRSWETRIQEPRGANPTYLSTNTEPRPTRTIKEEKDGPVEATELDGWSSELGNYAVKRSYVLAAGASPLPQFWAPGAMQGLNAPLTPGENSYVRHPGLTEPSPTGALAHQVALTTYTSDKTAALLDRPQMVETKVILAPATGAIGFTSRTQNHFDSGARAHISAKSDQLDLLGGTNALSLSFTQQPLGLFKVNQLQGVTLASNVVGTDLSGQVGVTYDYEPTGRFLTSVHQLGVDWHESEPDHDDMGRPLSHQDPNGFTTRYAWDILGRLREISPASPESATAIKPENSLRKTTLTRDSQILVYHYNGFGELTGEERTGPDGQVSHKIHGYDNGGRKTFETTWQPGPVADLNEWATSKAGGTGITAWAYDDRGRVIQEVNANGEITTTDYLTPLRTQRKINPDVAGIRTIAITTFDKDVLGRLVKVTDAAGQVTSYAYNSMGRIRQVQQGLQTRTWTYDLFGRLESLVQPESGITRYEAFTVTGKPTRTTYGYGSATPKTIFTKFDPLSRLLSRTSDDGTVDQAFAYDGIAVGGHDNFGHALAQLSYSRDQSIELWHSYSGLNGRLSGLDMRIGDSPDPGRSGQVFTQTFEYARDGLRQSASIDGRTQRLTLDAFSRLPLGVTHRRSDGYTLMVANLTQDATLWAPTRIDYGNGAATNLSYRPDQMGLASLSHTLASAATPKINWIYSYDGAGWLRGDGQDTYQYDAVGRLTQAMVQRLSTAQVITQNLTYDAVGNQLSSTATTNVGTLPSSLCHFTFSPNATELAQHNQLPAAQTGARYDVQGNLTYVWKTVSASGPFIQLTYDALGRVLTMYDSASGLKEAYAYTPEGLRARIDTYNGSILQKTHYKIYNDQRQMMSEYEIVQAEAPKATGAQASKTEQASGRRRGPHPKTYRQTSAARKDTMILTEGKEGTATRPSKQAPTIRYRNNDGSFPVPTPSLIDNNGPAGAYITYPIGAVTVSQGFATSFSGATDFGTDYTWDFGDGTPVVSGSFDAASRTTPAISHTFNTLSHPTFQVTFSVRNTIGGYTLSTATIPVTVLAPALPVINAFTAENLKDTATVYWGDAARLAWDVAGATSLTIDQGVGIVSPATQGALSVENLQSTTTYTLTATNASGSVTQGVRVRVLPKIQSFTADANPVDAGAGTTLTWNVAGATTLSLQEGTDAPHDVTGSTSQPVHPLAPTDYLLTAANPDGVSPGSLLRLNIQPVISALNASPDTISPGQTSTLSWATVGTGLVLTLDQGIGTVTGESQAVSPSSTTMYTLTAANSYTSVSRSVQVTVNDRPILLAQPTSRSVTIGQTATFSVAAVGQGSLTYQWMRNGFPISGAISATYETPPAVAADNGSGFTVMVTNAYGSVLSQVATLTVMPDTVAPTVTTYETGTSGVIAFTATASDDISITRVEFYVDGALQGTTAVTPYRLTMDSSKLSDTNHTVIAKAYDPAGNIGISPPVVFAINNASALAPRITGQPIDQTVPAGQPATFAVTASGSGALTYQWYMASPGGPGTTIISTATDASYTTPATTLADSGAIYTVTISNAYGSVTSAPATLTVTPHTVIGVLVWKRDIVYVGTKEVGEVDTDGLHITQVDHLGSPRLLSDKNGNLEDEQKYMPFGQYLDGQQKSHKGFTGHEQTDPSGLIYMQARFYAPWYGRFLSPDPARDQHFEETQSWNIYSYCQNVPTMRIDPDGMKDDWVGAWGTETKKQPVAISRITSPTHSGKPGSSRITSDSGVKATFDGIAKSLGGVPIYSSGDRTKPVPGGAKKSDHMIKRGQDGHVKGKSDSETFKQVKDNPSLIPPTGYTVIHHGKYTATQGEHIHVGRGEDGSARYSRPSELKVEGLSPETKGKYKTIQKIEPKKEGDK